jgi:hypothetical protein
VEGRRLCGSFGASVSGGKNPVPGGKTASAIRRQFRCLEGGAVLDENVLRTMRNRKLAQARRAIVG